MTQKAILEIMQIMRFEVLVFDRTTGKRICSVGNCNPLRALGEIGVQLPILDRTTIAIPTEVMAEWGKENRKHCTEINLEQAVELSKDKRVEWFRSLKF